MPSFTATDPVELFSCPNSIHNVQRQPRGMAQESTVTKVRSRPDSSSRIAVLRKHVHSSRSASELPDLVAPQSVPPLEETRGRHRSPDQAIVGGWVPDRVAAAGSDPPEPVVEQLDDELYDDELYDDELYDDEEGGDEPFGNELIGDDPAEQVDPPGDVAVGARRSTIGARRLSKPFGRFAELWVPEPLRDARVDPGRRGVVVLLLVAALAAVATAFGVWRDQPQPRPVDSSAIAALAVPSVPGSTSPIPTTVDSTAAGDQSADHTAAQPTEILVSVTGLVARPSVVTLPAGARVADAIAAAGGAAAEADLTGVNLAARLADGDSVVVGSTPASGAGASGFSGATGGSGASAATGPAGGLINLNTADLAALDTLPGVGPVMAQNILAWRETNGTFSSIEQLQEISGIGPSRYAQISPLVTVS